MCSSNWYHCTVNPFSHSATYGRNATKWLCRKKCRIACAALSAIVIIVSPMAQAQPPTLKWSKTYSGAGLAEGRGVAVDGDGVYVTGRTRPEGGTDDAFLLKYGLAGDPVWDRTWGAAGRLDQGYNVVVSGAEVHIAGNTRRYTRDNEPDAMTLKYDTDGVLDRGNSADGWWTLFTSHGYNGYDYAWDLALDPDGNLYVTGQSELGYNNTWSYVEQYDPAGVKNWHDHYGIPGVGRNTGTWGIILSENSLYTAGWQTPDGVDCQLVILKHQANGTSIWKGLWGDARKCEVGIDVAVSGSDIYITGYTGSRNDPKGRAILLVKLHDDGNSVRYVDSAVYDGPGDDMGWGIELVGDEIFIVGYTDVGGNTDALLLGYDANLNPLWDLSWGAGMDDAVRDVAFHDGVLYVTGVVDNEAFVNAYVLEDACTRKEKIKKAKCAGREGAGKLKVKLIKGVPEDSFAVKLSTGERYEGSLNRKGRAKVSFRGLPSGDGTATATWGCGAKDEREYSCP